jgi:ATP-dependent Lon protease
MSEEFLLKELKTLNDKVKTSSGLPMDLKERLDLLVDRLNRIAQTTSYSLEFDTLSNYIDVVLSIPWGKYSQDNLDIENARTILDRNHFGLDEVKERILEHLAVRKILLAEKTSSQSQKAPVLCLVGLQGVGKTTIAKSISEALGRQFVRIAMGALGSTIELRGRSKSFPDAEPGQIIKALVHSGVRNPLILLDEMDKVSGEMGLRSDFMAIMLELLDPEQNISFRDHYLDYPLDLSDVMFVGSANGTGTFSAALMDRLEIIQMPSYSDSQKETIIKSYLLPKVLAATGLTSAQLTFSEDVWPKLIRPLGYDSGIRSLQRIVEAICRKTALLIVEKKVTKVTITSENIKEYLPKY